MKKYYFLVYSCHRINWPHMGGVNSSDTISQAVTKKHPIQWQLDCNGKYGHEQFEKVGGGKFKEDYKVTFYAELTEEEYHKFKGTVG